MLALYDWDFVEQAKELRGFVVAKILEETSHPDARIRLRGNRLTCGLAHGCPIDFANRHRLRPLHHRADLLQHCPHVRQVERTLVLGRPGVRSESEWRLVHIDSIVGGTGDNANCAPGIPLRRTGRFRSGGSHVGVVVVGTADHSHARSRCLVRRAQPGGHTRAAATGDRRTRADAKSPFEALTEARQITGCSDSSAVSRAG